LKLLTSLKSSLKTSALRGGIYHRKLRRDRFPGVAVLCYHGLRADDLPVGTMAFEQLHVRAGEFAGHCRLIRECCDPISPRQWLSARAKGEELPRRPVLVTFDDGYRSVLTLGLPLLRKYEIPAALFVCTEPCRQRRLFWHDAVARASGEQAVLEAKQLDYASWRSLSEQHATPVTDDAPDAPLTIDDLRQLTKSGLIEIGGHTANHAILARADLAQQREEVLNNKLELEAWLHHSVSLFSYPNGEPERDYTTDTAQLISESGFRMAFTTRHRFAGPEESPWELSRLFMLSGISSAELAHRLCFSWRC
jgi:peptidoglycan/xylan/chitin deacetylase (PgdA/CDA1 family)